MSQLRWTDPHGMAVASPLPVGHGDVLRALARASHLAYLGPAALEEALGTVPVDLRSCSPRTRVDPDTQLLVLQQDGWVVLAFRGSEMRVNDWVLNARAVLLSDTGGGRRHAGFHRGLTVTGSGSYDWEALKAELVAKQAADPALRLWITGHSLGGALATLAALDLLRTTHVPLQGVATFGQPRVGDGAWATSARNALGDRYLALAAAHDPVPHLPLGEWGYQHVPGVRRPSAGGLHDVTDAQLGTASLIQSILRELELDDPLAALSALAKGLEGVLALLLERAARLGSLGAAHDIASYEAALEDLP
ncbi:MAG: hypothetical protein H6806_06515 [Planctomycetes bacterium]|nr:hypothetical protein [Planctomycetota bacterium]MCB9825165.1 hypothetical protein [Planctomycetota bacterium]MCB9829394.1 hypothetical protein [Planctomycetota bacterium]MCB9901987.1 hypothetical protein [Planctomycetota bacterium]